ncbi:MAG: class I SAM-dependent methyltransferase [Bdellovibrionota bacterium]
MQLSNPYDSAKDERRKRSTSDSEFDKYYYYMESVQSPETDAEFLRDTYIEINSKVPKTLREDFCGTFAVCCEWAKLGEDHLAYGVDIDSEPIQYGLSQYHALLSEEQKTRVNISKGDVLKSELPRTDVSCSLNFSYFCFKERNILKAYLQRTYNALNPDGIHVLDCFGGGKCQEANEEETIDEELNYSYFWDQDSFNPINHHAQFYIHFQKKGEKKREKVFSYDWRMWSLPELRDILLEVGYKDVLFYWEGTDEDGEGDGTYTRTEDPQEECEAWVAYIVAKK